MKDITPITLFLKERNFSEVSRFDEGGFGDFEVVFASQQAQLRVISDKGQLLIGVKIDGKWIDTSDMTMELENSSLGDVIAHVRAIAYDIQR